MKTALVLLLLPLFLAQPARAGNSLQDHETLIHAIEQTGTEIYVNSPDLCGDNWGGGGYFTNTNLNRAAISVCQARGANAGDGNQVRWTENDLNTLRHEAIHLIQDCKVGTLADGLDDTIFSNPALRRVVSKGLSERAINRILFVYRKNGVSDKDILRELEAFSLAENVPASNIAIAVRNACNERESEKIKPVQD